MGEEYAEVVQHGEGCDLLNQMRRDEMICECEMTFWRAGRMGQLVWTGIYNLQFTFGARGRHSSSARAG